VNADEALTTTRAVRKRLDLDRPVDLALVRECLEIAVQAPTGSNRQGWHFIVVTDPGKREALADLYRRSFEAYRSGSRAPDTSTAQMERVIDSADHLSRNLGRVPVHLVPAIEGRIDAAASPPVVAASFYGSILPAVWSFMLAARTRGLGTAWTTLHLAYEKEAAAILGIPFEHVTQVALVPVAHTTGGDFRPAIRKPLDDCLHWNTW
jgi:nitroreductase